MYSALQLSLLDAGLAERQREIFLCIADELALRDGLPSRYLVFSPDAAIVDQSAVRASIRMHVREIRAVEAARLRIKNGTYGRCENCGVEISFGYAYTRPTTTRCPCCDGELGTAGVEQVSMV